VVNTCITNDRLKERLANLCIQLEQELNQLSEITGRARRRDTATDSTGIKWLIELPLTAREVDTFNALTGWNAIPPNDQVQGRPATDSDQQNP